VNNYWLLVEIGMVWILTWGLVPHVLAQRTKSPAATLAWIWAILLIPIAGALFYLLLGSERIQRKRLKRLEAIRRAMSAECARVAPSSPQTDLSTQLPELEKINGMPSANGNSVKLLPDGVSFFPQLLEVIRNAQHHLHLQFYIWNRDKVGRGILDELVQAARRGVKVRLLLDEVGSFWVPKRFFAPLVKAGGEFSWFKTFAPLKGLFHLNLRNHRKLVIADGQVALTGGMNVGDEYWMGTKDSPPYRDLQLEVRGPVVTQLAQQFAQDWHFATGKTLTDMAFYPPPEAKGDVSVQVVAGGPDNDLNEIQLSILSLLHRAKERLWMTTPYFVPEPPLLAALQLAAMRGVDVRILLPKKADHRILTVVTRSYYEDLIPHGVRVYEYSPRLIHAKVTTIDGIFCMAGSANLDIRSLRINFELNLLIGCERLTRQLDEQFLRDVRDSHRVTWEEHQSRSFRKKMAEALCRPLAPML
jgi:cardiolipin synthase